jgi:L-ascorbate metabolism protein UlaG (beta-lactamase superfamily)
VDVALIPVGTLNIDEAMLFENALSTAEVVNPK